MPGANEGFLDDVLRGVAIIQQLLDATMWGVRARSWAEGLLPKMDMTRSWASLSRSMEVLSGAASGESEVDHGPLALWA